MASTIHICGGSVIVPLASQGVAKSTDGQGPQNAWIHRTEERATVDDVRRRSKMRDRCRADVEPPCLRQQGLVSAQPT